MKLGHFAESALFGIDEDAIVRVDTDQRRSRGGAARFLLAHWSLNRRFIVILKRPRLSRRGLNRRDFLAAVCAAPAFAAGCRAAYVPPRVRASELGRIGASTACLAGVSLGEAIRTIDRLGFDTLEMIAYTGARHSMGAIPGFDFHSADPMQRRQMYEATRVFDHISAHMPFTDVHLLSSDAEVRRAGVDTIQRAMDGLAFLEGSVAVVHAGWPEEGKSFRDVWTLMLDTFRSLGDYAGERGLKIGLETMQPDSVEEYTELIFDVDHPAVGATVDTGHIRGATEIGLPPARQFTPEGTERFNVVLNNVAELLGDHVLHVHLTDVRGSDWKDHQTVGSGIIDFPRFFETLDQIEYGGLLVFELEEPNQTAALRASKTHVEQILRVG